MNRINNADELEFVIFCIESIASYLNKNGSAIAMLLLSIFIIGLPITIVWYWIDFIILLVHAGDNDYIEELVNK